MCKVKYLIILLFVLFVSAISANADQIIQTEPFSGIPYCQSPLTFDKFDPSDGILDSIEIILYIDITGGKLYLDNDSDSVASGNAYFGVSGELSSSDVRLLNGSSWTRNTVNIFDAILQEDDGDADVGGTSYLDFTGDDVPMDYVVFDGTTVTDGDMIEIDTDFHSDYTGSGTFVILAEFAAYTNTSALGGVQYAVDPVSTSGHVQVTYTYTIPEPMTIVLLGMGSLGLLGGKKHIR